MRRWTGAVLGVATVLPLVVAGASGAAHASPVPAAPPGVPVTTCDGDVPPLTAAGDLVLGGTCTTPSLAVGGDLWLLPGADVTVRGLAPSTVGEDLLVGEGAALSLGDTDVAGRVWLDDADALALWGSSVGRSVRGTTGSVYVGRSRVGGAVNVAVPREGYRAIVLHQADVGGWVNTYGGEVSLAELRAGRGLTVSWADTLVLCNSTVAADTTVRHVRHWVTLAGAVEDDHTECGPNPGPVSGRNVLGGDLLLLDNRGTEHPTKGILVTDTVVAGDLACRGNGRTPVLGTVVVGGARSGQCA